LPLAESYGQSELGGFMALGDPVLVPEQKFGAAGRPLPDKEVRILNADGIECPLGEVGEVCLRGGFMKSYWGKPEKTLETLRGGWLHSGDAGTMDADGYITMRGRFAELITVGGRTWFPRDIEEALCAQPGVKEAAVIGLPDGAVGQRPIAFVTVTSEVDLLNLKQAIAPLVPYDLAPLTIRSLSDFPMTPTGKIAKADLRQNAMAQA
jgi:acyl-coenzyme A synthetase/AMP-(fatty) acid ligase